jgi:hypothetical protein
LNAIADRKSRFGCIHSEQNPAISRSQTRRLGEPARRALLRLAARAIHDQKLVFDQNGFRNHRT